MSRMNNLKTEVLWIHVLSLFLKGTIFHWLRFSFRASKTSLIMILRVKHDPLGSTFYGTSIIWYYVRKLACARKHGSCLYSPFVDTHAINFRDAFVTDHKTKHRDHKLDRPIFRKQFRQKQASKKTLIASSPFLAGWFLNSKSLLSTIWNSVLHVQATTQLVIFTHLLFTNYSLHLLFFSLFFRPI